MTMAVNGGHQSWGVQALFGERYWVSDVQVCHGKFEHIKLLAFQEIRN